MYTVVPLLALLKNEWDKRVDLKKHIHTLVIGTRLLEIVSSSQITQDHTENRRSLLEAKREEHFKS